MAFSTGNRNAQSRQAPRSPFGVYGLLESPWVALTNCPPQRKRPQPSLFMLHSWGASLFAKALIGTQGVGDKGRTGLPLHKGFRHITLGTINRSGQTKLLRLQLSSPVPSHQMCNAVVLLGRNRSLGSARRTYTTVFNGEYTHVVSLMLKSNFVILSKRGLLRFQFRGARSW
jgi:hypothetical protein